MRVNSNFHIHLKEPLTLGAMSLAPAGTPAQLFVVGKHTGKDGVTHFEITISQFRVPEAGTLPVIPVQTTVDAITTGMDIPATTAGALVSSAGRLRVSIPLTIQLSNDAPVAGFTPSPIRTPGPLIPQAGRRGRPTPTPTPSATPSPDPTATP